MILNSGNIRSCGIKNRHKRFLITILLCVWFGVGVGVG